VRLVSHNVFSCYNSFNIVIINTRDCQVSYSKRPEQFEDPLDGHRLRYAHCSLVYLLPQINPHLLFVELLVIVPIQIKYFALLILTEVEVFQSRLAYRWIGLVELDLLFNLILVFSRVGGIRVIEPISLGN